MTEKTPKPLLPVGDNAIIDHNIDRLISYGIQHINVTVNYLKEQIEDHYQKPRNGVKVGLSDHTMGYDVAVAAVALGATMVEKHFIIDRSIGGPDAAFSMEIEEFTAMVKAIRNVEKAIGKVTYPTDSTKIKGREFCRSLYVAEDIKKVRLLQKRKSDLYVLDLASTQNICQKSSAEK